MGISWLYNRRFPFYIKSINMDVSHCIGLKRDCTRFRIALISLLLCFPFYAKATVKLPALVSDGMVLQREKTLTIWGWAAANESIAIEFLKQTYNTVADEQGNWSVQIPAIKKSGGPYTMRINEIELTNILIGDVWLCSGQSNMELPVRRVLELYKDEVEAYSNSHIRHFKVPLHYNFHSPQTDISGKAIWTELTPRNALNFSAVAYFFAQELYEKHKVPIGLINSSVGGSPAQAWISEEGLMEFPAYLNEKRFCESDEYIVKTKNLDQKKQNLWYQTARKQDTGLNETIKWYAPDYDDSSWQTTDLLDASWGNDGVNPRNGTFWFRKEISIPESLAGQKAILRMGCIVDADSVFVNGISVGTTAYQYPPRIYQVPEGLLKSGRNNITVHLSSHRGFPHFVKDKPYKLILGSEEISLLGDWKYKQAVEMPKLEGETFFQYKPVGLFNAMIAPLKNYAIKGTLWYQGESNTERHNEYYALMSALIECWRTNWNQQEMPFLIVQLANFMQHTDIPTESQWAELRNAQLKLSHTIPHVGLAVTIDIGEWNDIHPLNKKEVGKRLSLQARRIAYHEKEIIADGPLLHSMQINENKLYLRFKEGTDSIQPVKELKGFTIAGTNGVFYPAKAKIENNRVVVWSELVSVPAKVRYAWADNPSHANLKNRSGLPASPFEAE